MKKKRVAVFSYINGLIGLLDGLRWPQCRIGYQQRDTMNEYRLKIYFYQNCSNEYDAEEFNRSANYRQKY